MNQRLMSELLLYKDEPRSQLGMMVNERWRSDPRGFLFTLARYKFVAKMFNGLEDVIEIGCGDGWATPLVLQEVGKLRGYDLDPNMIADANARADRDERTSFEVWDFVQGPVEPKADGCYLLDVIEHIDPGVEDKFMINLVNSLTPEGVCVIGSPSLESQPYASIYSKEGHVNCKSGRDWRTFLRKYFKNVFLFGMNDETLHTGYDRMSHFIMLLCTSPRPVEAA